MPEKRTVVDVVRVTLECPLCLVELEYRGDTWKPEGYDKPNHYGHKVYHYACPQCTRKEMHDIQYPFNDYVPRKEGGEGRLINPAGATITPQAREAIATLILTTLDKYTPTNWVLNWESPFQKFIPSYNHQTGQFSLRSTTYAQCAPAEWHRPKTAWDAVIREYPEELKIFLEIN